MPETAELYDDEVQEHLDDAAEHIAHAARDFRSRTRHLRGAAEALATARKALQTLRREVRGMPTGPARKHLEARAREHQQRIETLQGQMREAQEDGDRQEEREDAKLLDHENREEARNIATKIKGHQTGALASLARTEALCEQTEEVGQDTAETLKRQGDQLRRIDDELDELGGDIQRARKELAAFMRRMMTDRIILCCICLIILAIAGAIVLHYVKPHHDDTVDKTPAPPPRP
eukprot:TRINITY_DN5046_c0_g1_i1.p3 TRINITY_DN5046_c0_g1~~TRINITY_DN5046_c0_g1_i1.p3  ORF type:complete len:234 (+),score=74.68 TRINITY_DN5046_c0_g1_i1:156-857(+)